MARPGYLAEDTAARNALAQEADLARRAAQSRVSPSQALTVASGGAKPPVPAVQSQATAPPTAPRALPAPARPILSLPSGNIPSAVNRINGPASNALNAINGRGAFVPNAPPPSAAPVTPAASAPGTSPQLTQQVQTAIAQQAKQRASIAASGATAPTGAPVLSPQTAPTPQAPGVASRALSAAKTAGATTAGYASKALQGAARVAPVIAAGAEAASAYNDVTTDGMTGLDQAARVAEGTGRAAGAFAGAGLGAAGGAAIGGPAAPITGAIGGILGGIAGLAAPNAVNEASNRMFGTENQLASDKAAQLQQSQRFERGLAMQEALLTPEQRTAREQQAVTASKQSDPSAQQQAAAIRSGEIPTFAAGAGVTPAPTNEQRAAAAKVVQAQSAPLFGGQAPASAALANAQAPKTRDPTRYAEISGYTGPKKNVNRRYSLEELEKMGGANVIPAESFAKPGAGVAVSEASGGRESFGFGANPITQYQREVGAAQAQNQATNDRATALINARPDETTQRLMTGAERALNAGQKRKAAGFTDLLQAYNGGKPSDAMNRQRQRAPDQTPDEQAMAALKLQQEGSNADILQIQAGQAKQAAQLQEALLTAPPEQQAAISAQLDKVMGRQTPQPKPDPGAITDLKRYENLGRLAAAEFNPEKKAALIEQQKPLEEPPPVPGAKRGRDGNWYVVQNGQMMMVSP